MKAFLVCCFAEAARMHGGTARLAKVTLQSHTMVVEEETLPMEAL
ncbi:hypothetical protein APY03_0684 [Variovorax sp. WDL1]|nr:hypothetical protein APY03_0684 [Variovorax sp. WDL1]